MDVAKLNSGPLVRMAELEIDPAHLPAYTRLLTEEIEASIANEAGVLMLYALAVKDEPTLIRIVEVYADQSAYEAHLNAPHFLRYKTSTAAMVLSPRLVEMDPAILRSKPGQSGAWS